MIPVSANGHSFTLLLCVVGRKYTHRVLREVIILLTEIAFSHTCRKCNCKTLGAQLKPPNLVSLANYCKRCENYKTKAVVCDRYWEEKKRENERETKHRRVFCNVVAEGNKCYKIFLPTLSSVLFEQK